MKISSLAKSSLGQHLNRRTKGVLTLLVFAACYATLSTSPGDYSVRDKAHQDRRFLREQQEEGPDEGVFEPGYEELVGNQVLESSKEEEDLHEGFEEWAEYEEAETVGDSNESKRAIALISFGKEAAESTLLERCVLSIRRRGAFDGPVVVLTDAPRERYDGVLDDNVTVLNVKREDMKFDMFRNPVMKYKRFKTLTLEYMKKLPKLDNVDWVYYMDIDIMMGAPFDDLVNGLNEKYGIENTSSDGENDSPVSKLYMFKDPHATKFALNSGFIGMNRHTSERCLDVWREEMDSHPDAYFDQTTVNEIVNNRQDECEMVGMKHWQFLSYPGSDKSLDDMMRKSKFSHLIHIFNSCFAKRMSAETMEKFVGVVLQLSEEEKEQHKFGKVVITESKE